MLNKLNDPVAMAADLRRAGVLDTQCEGVFVLSGSGARVMPF